MQLKTTMSYHYIYIGKAKRKTLIIQSADKGVEQLDSQVWLAERSVVQDRRSGEQFDIPLWS